MFSDLIAALDSTVLDTFGNSRTVTIHFKDSYLDLTVPIVVKNPTYEEDYIPGSPASTGQGTSVLILFVHLTTSQIAAARLPLEGDKATVSGVDYDIFRVGADREDGRTLYLRRTNQRWDA